MAAESCNTRLIPIIVERIFLSSLRYSLPFYFTAVSRRVLYSFSDARDFMERRTLVMGRS